MQAKPLTFNTNAMIYRIITILLVLFSLNAHAQSTLPSVKIKELSGKEVLFDSILAKGDTATVICFWATWCIPCITELETINDHLPTWKKNAVFNFVAMSVDDARTAGKVRSFVKGKGWDFLFYNDVNNDLRRWGRLFKGFLVFQAIRLHYPVRSRCADKQSALFLR